MKWSEFVWRYLTHRRDLALVLLATMMICAAAEVTFPWLLQKTVDAALAETADWSLNRGVAWMVVTAGVIWGGHMLAMVVESLLFYEATAALRHRLYAHFYAQSPTFFHRHRTGELMHRITSDVSLLEDGMVDLFSDMPFSVMVMVGVLIVMAFTDWRLTLLALALIVSIAIITGYAGRPMPTIRRLIQIHSARLSGRLQESLSAMRIVQAFGNEKHEIDRLDATNRKIMATEIVGGQRRAFTSSIWELAQTLGIVLVLWYGGHMLIAKQISVGTLVAFIAYIELLAGPIGRIGSYYYQFQTCRAVAQRLQTLLTDHSILASPADKAPPMPLDTIDIVVNAVTFGYPNTSRKVLRDVSFTVFPGECVAVIGHNGAGKSTLLDLVARFYDPHGGLILAGGVDIRHWDLALWRGQIGVMPQGITLFNGSISENVAYGRPGAACSEIEHAVRQAGADVAIEKLPRGLDTIVGEQGLHLSGGERQLIALARLFLRNPKVLLLDEPTSHLDGESLSRVNQALTRLMAGRTTLLIAHRPETIRLATRIVILNKGCLAAEGTHDQLSAEQPLYHRLLHGANRDTHSVDASPKHGVRC